MGLCTSETEQSENNSTNFFLPRKIQNDWHNFFCSRRMKGWPKVFVNSGLDYVDLPFASTMAITNLCQQNLYITVYSWYVCGWQISSLVACHHASMLLLSEYSHWNIWDCSYRRVNIRWQNLTLNLLERNQVAFENYQNHEDLYKNIASRCPYDCHTPFSASSSYYY